MAASDGTSMSDLERRRFLRAFLSAPHALEDEELERIAQMVRAEQISRSASAVTWQDLLESVRKLAVGAPGRLKSALIRNGADESVEGVLSTPPYSLITVNGFGETTMLALFVALNAYGAHFPDAWLIPPTYAMQGAWALTRRARDERPAELLAFVRATPERSSSRFILFELRKIVGVAPPLSAADEEAARNLEAGWA